MSDESKTDPASRTNYPSHSLKWAVAGLEKLYKADRGIPTPFSSAVEHLGFKTMNGSSKVALASLRKFGLVLYSNGKVKVSSLGLTILHPKSPQERADAILEALWRPQLFAKVRPLLNDGHLPSDSTLTNTLIRDHQLPPGTATAFVKVLKESCEFAGWGESTPVIEQDGDLDDPPNDPPPPGVHRRDSPPLDEVEDELPASMQKTPMPGTDIYIVLPKEWDEATGLRVWRWLKKAVKAQIEVALDVDDLDALVRSPDRERATEVTPP